MATNIENLKKCILYRCSYRGTKENDLIISSFVNSIINECSYDQLLALKEMLDIPDDVLLNIGFKKDTFEHDNEMMDNIINQFIKFIENHYKL